MEFFLDTATSHFWEPGFYQMFRLIFRAFLISRWADDNDRDLFLPYKHHEKKMPKI